MDKGETITTHCLKRGDEATVKRFNVAAENDVLTHASTSFIRPAHRFSTSKILSIRSWGEIHLFKPAR